MEEDRSRYTPFFIHVLLNIPHNHPYLPILDPGLNTLTTNLPKYNGSFWNNAVGFEIIEGYINIVYPRAADEAGSFYLQLPGQPGARYGF